MPIVKSCLPAALFSFAILLSASPAAAVDPGFEVCASQFPLTPPLQRVIYALNAGSGARLDSIFAEGYRDATAMEAGTTWDFSGLVGDDRVLQVAPVQSPWSCSVGGACAGRIARAQALLVQDNYPAPPTRDVNAIGYNGSNEIFLRAQVSSEGIAGELRVCFDRDVAFVRFPNPGACASGGDPSWSTGFSCGSDKGIYDDRPCAGSGGPDAGINGSIAGRPIRNGTLTLPSGHVVDALLVETYANLEAEGLIFGACTTIVAQTIQQYLMMWVVPEYGPMVQLSSPGGNTDLSWQSVGSTTIGYGLLPPLSIQRDAATDTSITVSWDPGLFPGSFGADSFFVHWGMVAGNPTASSDGVGDTIPASQLSYTVGGLAPDTEYCISVSSGSTYVDPVAGVSTPYRSVELPKSIGADIDGDGVRDTSYPPEICVRTTGTAGAANLMRHDIKVELPLRPPPHAYLSLVPGSLDPDTAVLTDGRLWFYGWEGTRQIQMVIDAGRLRIH